MPAYIIKISHLRKTLLTVHVFYYWDKNDVGITNEPFMICEDIAPPACLNPYNWK